MEENIKENKNPNKAEAVALVNQEKITRGELDSYISQVAAVQKLSLPERGSEEAKEFERRMLGQMLNNILIFQDAESQGINISKEEVDSQLSAIAGQLGGREKLDQALEKTGIKAEDLRKDLERQNIIERYFNFVKEKNEISVSQEEVKGFYDKQVAPQKPDLELKAVEPQIRQRLEQEKLSRPIAEILQNLYKEAEIKILL